MPTYRILFVGLGKMGFHMAGYLSKNKNYKLFVFNRTKSVEQKWKKKFIAESYNFKNDIIKQVQPNIQLNSVWQYIRRYLLEIGVEDNFKSPYTSYSISEKLKKDNGART